MWFLPAYIDPGSGFQIFSSMGPLAGILLAALGGLLWPFRKIFGMAFHAFRRRPGLLIGVLILLISITVYFGIRAASKRTGGTDEKVIVLGMDGLDPGRLRQMMDAGKLPAFKRLSEKGVFSSLETVMPPQSPVAWSTFATGLNPGEHGIYDFLWRHEENYMPDLSLTEFQPAKKIRIFGLEIPWRGPVFRNKRQGRTFWKTASEAGVPVKVIHCPMTFPPEKIHGDMLAGMGVPDIRGSQGTFSFYTSRSGAPAGMQGGLRMGLSPAGAGYIAQFRGPWIDKTQDARVDFELDPEGKDRAILRWQDKALKLSAGEWSPWLRVEFPAPGGNMTAMTRVFLKSLEPDAEFYVSPFQFAPEDPAYAISSPPDYARKLKEAIGDFHTLGMPHDTWALNEGVMSEEMFLAQSKTILEEEKKMLRFELGWMKKGVLVFVMVTPDRIQHMFWRAEDPESPLYTEELAAKYGHVIEDAYRDMDAVLEIVEGYMDERTTLMVISDHGFTSFRRSVHLNSWLRNEGYLNYQPGYKEGGVLFQGVDWDSTRAYAVGLGGIFLNLKGREAKGIVEAGETAEALKEEIRRKLEDLTDPESQAPAVRRVYTAGEIFDPAEQPGAPDLVAGFEAGYRASWQTALGAAPVPLMEDNLRKWSGDHITDASIVPGIFLSNRPLKSSHPTLYDIGPTILALQGIEPSGNLRGKPLLTLSEDV